MYQSIKEKEYIIAKEREILEIEKKETERKRIDDLKAVLDLPQGRRLLFDIIYRQCGFYNSSYNMEHTIMAYNEGKKEVARELINNIRNINPVLIERLWNEEISKIESKKERLKNGKSK